jgi:hypothetical protein
VIPVYYLSVQPLLFISIVIHGIRCSIFGVKENKIIPSLLNTGTPEQIIDPLKENVFFARAILLIREEFVWCKKKTKILLIKTIP